MSNRLPKLEVGQESVWDYPRPPRIEDVRDRVRVLIGDRVIADSVRCKRVLETSHPPVYYIPPFDIDTELLVSSEHRSWCEWKGEAWYYTLAAPEHHSDNVAWFYPYPHTRFSQIASYVAFYPNRVDACFVNQERVESQVGDFYGGWITSKIVGPFKGGAGTFGW